MKVHWRRLVWKNIVSKPIKLGLRFNPLDVICAFCTNKDQYLDIDPKCYVRYSQKLNSKQNTSQHTRFMSTSACTGWFRTGFNWNPLRYKLYYSSTCWLTFANLQLVLINDSIYKCLWGKINDEKAETTDNLQMTKQYRETQKNSFRGRYETKAIESC